MSICDICLGFSNRLKRSRHKSYRFVYHFGIDNSSDIYIFISSSAAESAFNFTLTYFGWRYRRVVDSMRRLRRPLAQ